MTYRPLGSSGLMVSAVGVTLLDTADIYGVRPGASEELLGIALQGIALQGRREELVLATSCTPPTT